MNSNIKIVERDVRELKRLRREREDLDNQIKSLEEEIKGIMDKTKTYEFSGDDWKVTWNMVSSTRFNQSLFKENNPDLFSKYQSVSESRRFLLG